MADKLKKMKKNKKGHDKGKDKKASKKARLAEREAKKAARKGDGSFPDILVVTKEKTDDGRKYFFGHGTELDTLSKNGETVAVYKLRRVSTITINRKVAR